MVLVSLWLNILILIPVCWGLAIEAKWADAAWGEKTPARGILLSIYLAIFIASVLILLIGSPTLAAPLLAVQVFYKVTTPITVRSLRNPVVLSNLGIAAIHTITLCNIDLTLAN